MEKGGSLPGSWLQAVSPRDGALGTWERPSHRLPGKHVAPEITEAGRGSCGAETGGCTGEIVLQRSLLREHSRTVSQRGLNKNLELKPMLLHFNKALMVIPMHGQI